MTEPRLTSLLDQIVERSGLEPHQGHRLYAYRISREESEALRDAIRGALQWRVALKREDAAAFCLFAAEWFRRFHREGPWKWDTILVDGLGLDGDRALTFRRELDEVTRQGMAWWGQAVIRTPSSHRYLTTIACQGGLPLQVLRNHGATLRRYFRDVLRQYEKYRDLSAVSLAEELDYVLAPTLCQDVVYELTGTLIEAISNLRRQSLEADNAGVDRMEYLDQKKPEWRRLLPLQLDDAIAKELIQGLLAERFEEAESPQLAVETSLAKQQGEWTIVRRWKPSRSFTEAQLAAQLGIPPESLPPRFQLCLAAEGRRVAAATVARMMENQIFRLQPMPHSALAGPESLGRVRLLAVAGTRDLAAIDPAGGDVLPESPWVFEAQEPYRLLGVGSLTTRRPTVLVAVPPSTPWHDQSCVPIGTLSGNHRTILRVEGNARFFADGELTAAIRTSGEAEDGRTFDLFGPRCTLGPGGSEVWLGPPSVQERLCDETATRVKSTEFFWRPASGGTWRLVSGQSLGDVILRVFRDGEVLFQSRETILPETTRFRLLLGPGREQGRLRFDGVGDVQVHVGDHAGVTASVHNEGQAVEVRVAYSDERPSHLDLRMTFPGGAIAHVKAACPAPSIAVVDAAGRPWPKNLSIPVNELDGLRLQVITAQPGKLFVCDDMGRALARVAAGSGTDQAFELPLSLIQSQVVGLLARSADPDGSVLLLVEQHTRSAQRLEQIRVSRYVGSLECTSDAAASLSDQGAGDATQPRDRPVLIGVRALTMDALGARVERLGLEARPLGRPDDTPPADIIESLAPGKWRFHRELCTPGPWLVTAWLDERTCLRPMRVTVRGQDLPSIEPAATAPEQQFEAVLCMHDDGERRQAWDVFVGVLASDLSHPGWAPMLSLVDACRRLPVTTFEAVAALTRCAEAVAYLGILRPDDMWLWDRLQHLPFLWALVPVRAWVTAARRYVDHLRSSLSTAGLAEAQTRQMLEDCLKGFLGQGALRCPAIDCVAACLRLLCRDYLPVPAACSSDWRLLPNQKSALTKEIEHLRTRLVSEHDGDRWPTPQLWVPVGIQAYVNAVALYASQGYQNDVLRAPILAAACAVLDLPVDRDTIAKLQELRGFDPTWFDEAQVRAMFIMAGHRLSEDCRCFDT